MTRPAPVVRAAGGLVWRLHRDRVEVVLVHRPAPRDDWSFPKGKLEPGERHRTAALREVEEETGLRCCLGTRLADTRYVTPAGEDKRVRWWAMTVREDTGFHADKEVDALRWVPADELAGVLTHPDDRRLVHLLLTSGDLIRP
ncbi:MAG: NUDIX hydrolase [Microthrixaceae bacterium]